MSRAWFLLLLTLCTSCSSAYHGERIELRKVAMPDTVLDAEKAPAAKLSTPSLPPPMPSSPRPWRAYISPRVSANGDVIEGHYLEISTTAPQPEAMPPAKILPRAPLVQYQRQPQPHGPQVNAPGIPQQQPQMPPQQRGQSPVMPYGYQQGPSGPFRQSFQGPMLPQPGPSMPQPSPTPYNPWQGVE